MSGRENADLVVVGAGTVGGWASWFAKTDGVGRVVVLERGLAGIGASSRAAGIVRQQGGTPETVRLGMFSIAFYRSLADRIGTDAGFRQLGYIVLAVEEADVRDAHERLAMQRAQGLDVRWLTPDEAAALLPALDPATILGGTYAATDGCIDPPRNVRAYSLAMHQAGVELRERTAFTGLRTEGGGGRVGGARRVVGVDTSAGQIATERVLLTGGPSLAEVGQSAGIRIPVGAARHSVAVTERHGALAEPQPMAFDLRAGLYWRLEEDGLLFGWSDPDERPGEAGAVDFDALAAWRARLARYLPVTRSLGLRKLWAATIDYTSDHLPIVGPALDEAGQPIDGVWVASPAGHGMMWGPAVARVAADLVLRGATDLVDVSRFGLDRFDAYGRSRNATDPIALPFPS